MAHTIGPVAATAAAPATPPTPTTPATPATPTTPVTPTTPAALIPMALYQHLAWSQWHQQASSWPYHLQHRCYMTAQHHNTVTTPTSRDYVAVTMPLIIQSTWKGYSLAYYTFRSMIKIAK